MDFYKIHLPDNLLENFDTDLQDFYHASLTRELDLSSKANVVQIKSALREVVSAYKKDTVENFSSRINFDTTAKRCAYVFKHCPCFTSAVARHFLQLLHCNPSVLQHAMQRRKLSICCLGGGPASDAVAISKIVSALQYPFWMKDPRPLELTIIVVDLSGDWEVMAKNVLKTLLETPSFFDSDKMSLKFKFLKADLTEPMCSEVRDRLSKADLITMVYFLSAVNGSRAKDGSSCMVQEIMKHMKQGAMLFYLDSAKDLHYKGISSVVSIFPDMDQIYGPHLEEFHTLSMKSLKRFIELYSGQFETYLCLSNCFVSVSAWMKTTYLCAYSHLMNTDTARLKNLNFAEPKGLTEGNSWRKKVSFNTVRQERFRNKVQRLLINEFDLSHLCYEMDDMDADTAMLDGDHFICAGKVLYPSKSKSKRIFAIP